MVGRICIRFKSDGHHNSSLDVGLTNSSSSFAASVVVDAVLGEEVVPVPMSGFKDKDGTSWSCVWSISIVQRGMVSMYDPT